MKKKIFMVLSAVTVLAMGVLVVACSKDSNTLNPNEEVVVEDVVSAPTLQKTNSAAEWAAFNSEIEKLNAKYLTLEALGRAKRVAKDSGDVTKKHEEIVKADILGAVSGALGNSGKGIWNILGGAIIEGAISSYLAWDGMNENGCMIATNPLASIENLESDSLASIIGERHNILLQDMVSANMDVTTMSNSALLLDVTNRYERLFGTLSDSLRVSFLSINLDCEYDLSVDIEQAVESYAEMVVVLNETQGLFYTEDYLAVIDTTFADSDEKIQLLAGVGTGYYSASLWEIEEP